MGIRTDIAAEAHELSRGKAEAVDGVTLETLSHGGIKRTVVEVLDDNGAKAIGKSIGKYITIDAQDMKYSTADYEAVCNMLAEDLRKMCNNSKSTLVIGLGNRKITPDALGAEVVDNLLITNHMKRYMPETFGSEYGSVSAIVPGVMGTTGIETAEIIKGVIGRLNPDTIIAIDALACADASRLAVCIQLSNAGIAPGSGVGNHRDGLNYESLGIKVIAVGVPTVISAEILGGADMSEELKSLMVTVKDIDLVIKRMSKAVANGINMALHKNLTIQEIEELVG